MATYKKDNGWAEPCHSRSQPAFINLSRLPKEKKRAVWQQIQRNYPEIAELLKSDHFQVFKAQIVMRFGQIETGVDLKDIGGSLYDICQ